MELQFFPTPVALAKRAWDKFQNKNIVRVLEPSAGEGHMLAPKYEGQDNQWRIRNVSKLPVDCVEIDISRHAILRSKGYNVVGVDFMEFTGVALYSHIILNPPFNAGASHVLKAWNMLFDGELVAIINAETIRNPFSAERRLLVSLIEQHGSVEFLQDEFMSSEAERKADVEIALVYLRKESNFQMDFLGGLEQDSMTASGLATGFQEFNEVAVYQGVIDNLVTAFNAAVKAARETVFAEAKCRYYNGLLGDTMETLQSKDSNVSAKKVKANLDEVRKDLQGRYDDLKNRAWTQVLRSTQVTSRLSSKAQQRLESEFENVKQLEFTSANIYGFILGLISKQSEINIDMACDVFDAITKYHSDNRVYFKGWKSNDKHRTAGMKIKATRFVIPGHGDYAWSSTPSWETNRFLQDFDKVFAMLDGRKEPEVPLADAFSRHYEELKRGERISSSYFDVRFYQIGTIHFFPTDKKLIDRFNRLVGRHRQWIPPEGEKVSDAFWLQFDKAEKFAGELSKEIKKCAGQGWRNDIELDIDSNDDSYRERALTKLDACIDTVLTRHGIDPISMLEKPCDQKEGEQRFLQLELLAA